MTRAAPPEERMKKPTRAERYVAIRLYRSFYSDIRRKWSDADPIEHRYWDRVGCTAIALGACPPSPPRAKKRGSP